MFRHHWLCLLAPAVCLAVSTTAPAVDCNQNAITDSVEANPTQRSLAGGYWTGQTYTLLRAGRLDATIDFDWGQTGFSVPGYTQPFTNDFAIRWTGSVITPAVAGDYRFEVEHNDGCRLWVNGRLLVGAWAEGGGSTHSGTITLAANARYAIRLEYFENTGDAKVKLRWQVPETTTAVVIPSGALRPIYDQNANNVPDECELAADCNGNYFEDAADIANGNSTDCNSDGIPDECQTLPPAFDCNGNTVCDQFEDLGSGLTGAYYQGMNFEVFVGGRIDPIVDFEFDATPPTFGDIILLHQFSVRWLGSVRTPDVAGSYRFEVLHDDGCRLWVNGQLIIDEWHEGGGADSAIITLQADTRYALRLEFYENGIWSDAHLRWQVPGGALEVIPTSALFAINDQNGDHIPDECQFAADCNHNLTEDALDIANGASTDCNYDGVPDECQIAPATDCDDNGLLDACLNEQAAGLSGEYWATNRNSLGEFVQRVGARVDPTVNFDWSGSPIYGLTHDYFAVRWQAVITTPAAEGTYTFFTQTDDGVRLWVDQQLLIDHWVPQSGTEWSGAINLTANATYAIKMEYFQEMGSAVARLLWQVPGGVKEIIPSAVFSAAPDCNHNGTPDSCDIANGTSQDADGNGLPDECPATACVPLGDFNGDTLVDGRDIQGFVACVLGSGLNCACGDFNASGQADLQDITGFVAALLGSVVCPLPGDLNHDQTVNGLDIQGFVACILDDGDCSCADLNGDGQPNIQDIPAFVSRLLDR